MNKVFKVTTIYSEIPTFIQAKGDCDAQIRLQCTIGFHREYLYICGIFFAYVFNSPINFTKSGFFLILSQFYQAN
jgi:hypothetical protein